MHLSLACAQLVQVSIPRWGCKKHACPSAPAAFLSQLAPRSYLCLLKSCHPTCKHEKHVGWLS